MSVTSSKERVRASADERLLYSRKQAAELLGNISLATLKRLEDEGILEPVRLNKRSATGQVSIATATSWRSRKGPIAMIVAMTMIVRRDRAPPHYHCQVTPQ
jgi:hypothetical protein